MKIGEKVTFSDDQMIVQKRFSVDPAIAAAQAIRDTGQETQGESKIIGVVPYALWLEWAKKWGVNVGDHAAMRDVLKREMENPDNAKLRVWTGTY